MKSYIPYEKLPKKKQREIDRQQRSAWGVINPVTRCPERSDVYDRQNENRRWKANAQLSEHNSNGGVFLRRAL